MSEMTRQANLKLLREAEDKQNLSKEAIWRIQRQAAETEQIGTATLEELRKQGQQMDDIGREIDEVSAKLDQSQSLQNKFDMWAGNWLGGKKRAAIKEAQAEIAQRQAEENLQVGVLVILCVRSCVCGLVLVRPLSSPS